MRSKRNDYRQLRAGYPSAQGTSYLRLLPSGPDRIHMHPLRKTHSSTLRVEVRPHIDKAASRNSISLQRVASYRAPLPPHLAR
jgi:hypothetical protein